MISEEKIKWVKKQLRKGVSDGEIRNQLAEEGYSVSDVNRAFTGVHKNIGPWLICVALGLLCWGIYLGVQSPPGSFIPNKILPVNGIIGIDFIPFLFSGLLFYEYYKTRKKKN